LSFSIGNRVMVTLAEDAGLGIAHDTLAPERHRDGARRQVGPSRPASQPGREGNAEVIRRHPERSWRVAHGLL
jgi:hypothetical protein